MKLYLKLLMLILLVFFSGCMPYKPNQAGPEIEVPNNYQQDAGDAKVQLPDKWWQAFNSKELNELVEQALSSNLTVEQAWYRLKQAEMVELKARAGKQPGVDAIAGFGKTRSRSETAFGDVEMKYENWSLGLSAGYEVDLWGKVESQVKSAQLQVLNTREAVNTAATTIVGQVVESWLQILSQRQQKTILQQQLKANENILELIELRFNMSMVTALDVFQQQQTIEQVRSAIPLIESAEKVQLNRLAVLMGQNPGSIISIKQQNLPQMPALPNLGLPSELLTNRPDIQSAIQSVEIANWNLATAKADKLPSFRITAAASYGDDNLEDLFDNWVMNLAANLAVPLLDGNRREAEVERTKAVIAEKTAVYKSVFLSALSEVENALLQEHYMQENIDNTYVQLDFARKAFSQAKDQYLNGISNYLQTLTALLKVQSLERDLISKQAQLLGFRTTLYRSLGGRWYDDLQRPELVSKEK